MNQKEKYISELKELIKISLKKLGLNEDMIVSELPPSRELGDAAFPLFKYAGMLKQKPFEIASKIKEDIENSLLIEKIDVKGPYLNIFFNKKIVSENILKEILEKKQDFGKQQKKNIKVVIEFSSPNTNKPLHLGHCRNNVLGDSISKIYDNNGYDVTKINLINDRGIHICKSMLAYKLFGNGTTPEKEGKKSDHFVGDYYVRYAKESDNDKTLEEQAQKMLFLWEQKDKKTLELWKQMNKWAIDGILETYKKMGIRFDSIEYESLNYLFGKDIIAEGLENGVFYKEADGSVWINNEDVGLDKKAVLRSDGTSIYITQDLGTVVKRNEKYGFNKLIYVVGSEQIYHFKTLFATLKKLGFKWANQCFHLSYGMVNLPEGKMKSREGKVVDADNLMDLLYEMSMDEINLKQRDLTDDEKKDIASKISLSALKYYLLNFSTAKDVMFIPEKSISFDGNTGPYLQYTTARINSLIVKAGNIPEINLFDENYPFCHDEWNVISQLLDYENAVIKAGESLSPVDLCTYLYDLARLFNKFYHDNSILTAETETSKNIRLAISKATLIVLENGLNLLGISSLKKM
jgi:arginyl-tRNA synthetase